MSLNYTTIERIMQQEPKLDNATLVSSSDLHTFAEDAEAEIDGILAARFTVPISGSPPLLTTVATKLTVGLVLSQRIFTQERLQDSEWPNAFLRDARNILDKLSNGMATLVASGGTVVEGRNDLSEVWSNTAAYHPNASELDVTRNGIDPDKITDLSDDRNIGWPEALVR